MREIEKEVAQGVDGADARLLREWIRLDRLTRDEINLLAYCENETAIEVRPTPWGQQNVECFECDSMGGIVRGQRHGLPLVVPCSRCHGRMVDRPRPEDFATWMAGLVRFSQDVQVLVLMFYARGILARAVSGRYVDDWYGHLGYTPIVHATLDAVEKWLECPCTSCSHAARALQAEQEAWLRLPGETERKACATASINALRLMGGSEDGLSVFTCPWLVGAFNDPDEAVWSSSVLVAIAAAARTVSVPPVRAAIRSGLIEWALGSGA